MKVKILLKTEKPTVIEEICTFNNLNVEEIAELKNLLRKIRIDHNNS